MTLEKQLKKIREITPDLDPQDLIDLELAAKRIEKKPEFQADLLKSTFIEDILQAMKDQELSQSDVARKLGCKRQYFNKLLNEDRRVNFTIETMTKLVMALGKKLYVGVLEPEAEIYVYYQNTKEYNDVDFAHESKAEKFDEYETFYPLEFSEEDFYDEKTAAYSA